MGRHGRHALIRPFGALLALLLAALVVAPELSALRPLRFLVFDTYQVVAPRARVSGPALVVDIDDASLARHGQWPWPRTLLADLVARIARDQPAAIGLDILMPEPDRLSPERVARIAPDLGPDLVRRLSGLESHDARLARALGQVPTVLAMAGVEQVQLGAGPITQPTPVRAIGGEPGRFVRRFGAAVQSLAILRRAAADQGLTNADPDGRIVRRVPLAAAVGDAVVGSLGIALLRVASGTPALTFRVDARGVESVAVGDLVVPTQPDGTVWLRFAPHDPARFVPAAEVLAGRVAPGEFARKLVIVGATAVGLGDHHQTPVATSMAGPEIHVQLLESLFDGDLLRRPRWMPWAEAAVTAAVGLAVVLTVPLLSARTSLLAMLGVVAAAPGAGFAAYRYAGLLVDVAVPAACLVLVFTGVLGATLAETQRQRRALRQELERQREAAARLAGELAAARQVQMDMLPDPATTFPGERRFAIYAHLAPAREVGGDLYDFFRLDERRVFFLIGDVSGKGMGASVFMAISRALYKSTALRRHDAVAAIMREANAEVSRDNPETFFVTVCAGVLDADTGVLTYCNAGHETPLAVATDGTVRPLAEGGGPPLCVDADFSYAAATYRMHPGEAVCLVTDGVTEAVSVNGGFYGRARLRDVLAAVGTSASAAKIGETVWGDVERHAAGHEQSDDMAVLVVQWTGGPDMAPRPPDARSVPGNPGHSSNVGGR